MATYVNNLRLKEISTGDESGTWGTSTNTNLTLVGEAFGYATKAVANASTDTLTIPDGSETDSEPRRMYLKLTGGGQACTVTLAPNTVSKVWLIENATSYTLTMSQGSGANVAILAGQVKMIATDGAGSGAAVYDLLQDLAIPDLFIDDDLKLQSDGAIISFGVDGDITLTHTADTGLTTNGTFQATTITATTAFVPDASDGAALGTSSLEFSDLFLADAAVINLGADQDTTLTHVADTGILLNSTRQLQFGDSGTYIHQSADGVLDLVSDTEIEINATTIDINGAVDISGNTAVGGTLTSTGKITADAGIDIDNINIDGTTVALSSGDLTLDVAGDIILDADGADIKLLNDGTHWGSIYTNATPANLYIQNMVSDGDIYLSGSDGGSNINALVLDMSEGGNATFVGQIITSTAGSNNVRLGDGAGAALASGSQRNVVIGSNAGAALTTGDYNIAVGYNALDAEDTGSRSTALGYFALSAQNNDADNNNTAVGFTALEATTTGTENTAVGAECADAITEGSNNTAVGYEAMGKLTTGTDNVAVGRAALLDTLSGAGNVAVGVEALENNTGNENTAVGKHALRGNTTGGSNVAIGINALNTDDTGSYTVAIGRNSLLNQNAGDNSGNVAVGYNTGQAITTATGCTLIGYISGDAITTGGGNTAYGYGTLTDCTTGDSNTAMGYECLEKVTTGIHNTGMGYRAGFTQTTGSYNVTVGNFSGDAITTATYNTHVGYGAGSEITTGTNNTTLGANAGSAITTGRFNTCIGPSVAGDTLTTGEFNVYIGYLSRCSAVDVTGEYVMTTGNTLAVGKGANTGFIDCSGGVFQDNNSSSWSTTSDRRIKKNIEDNNIGLDAINKIKVRNFEYRTKDEITEVPSHAAINKEGIQLGVIAQEIETILPDVVEEQSTGVKTVNPDNMTWYLVNAVKELSTQIEELKAKLNEGE